MQAHSLLPFPSVSFFFSLKLAKMNTRLYPLTNGYSLLRVISEAVLNFSWENQIANEQQST